MNLLLLEPSDFISESVVRIFDRRHIQLRDVIKASPGKSCKAGLLNGKIGRANVAVITPEMTELSVTLSEEPPPKLPVTLLVALPRPKTFLKVLHTATVMGVKRILFFESWKVDKSYWNTPLIKLDEVKQQLLLALEQAMDTVPPQVDFRRRFKPFIEDEFPGIADGGIALIAHPGATEPMPRYLSGKITLLVGPEGGFTDYEINLLKNNGATPVSFGPRIMRTEFAVTALLAGLTPPGELQI
ncbi:MAG: 16S rRNA (uracil(1498)-N(3))-methyltransferase [Victivallales bacterium]|nr:16S rRNA (uracil(1498)-N(3))-methyltransferase [Victivallales bacterium]